MSTRPIHRVPLPTRDQLVRATVLDPADLDPSYEVVRLIGLGGMAKVYEVRCRRYQRRLALKVLRPDAPDLEQVALRFKREAWLLRRLDHPNCVKLVEWGRTRSGGLFLLMELADGRPLTDWLGRVMPVVQALEVVRQVLLALQHAHLGGIVHRDIKPDNVMLVETAGRMPLVKLLDFGLGKQVVHSPFAVASGDQPRQRRLTSGMVVGTPTYMAPELLLGEPASFSSDIYGVGVMLYYLLTGRKPVDGHDAPAVMRAKLQRPAPRLGQTAPRTFSPELERLVARALSRAPARRGGCAELLTAVSLVQRSPGRGLALPEKTPSAALRAAGRRLIDRLRQLRIGSPPALQPSSAQRLR